MSGPDAPGTRPETTGGAPEDAGVPGEAGSVEAPRRSGLRNPPAAVRGVGIGVLVLEFLVVLLALQPIRIVAPETSVGGLAGVAVAGVGCLLAAGTLRHAWGWLATAALQGVMILVGFTGLVHWMLAAIGLIFLPVWLYVMSIRRTVVGSGR